MRGLTRFSARILPSDPAVVHFALGVMNKMRKLHQTLSLFRLKTSRCVTLRTQASRGREHDGQHGHFGLDVPERFLAEIGAIEHGLESFKEIPSLSMDGASIFRRFSVSDDVQETMSRTTVGEIRGEGDGACQTSCNVSRCVSQLGPCICRTSAILDSGRACAPAPGFGKTIETNLALRACWTAGMIRGFSLIEF